MKNDSAKKTGFSVLVTSIICFFPSTRLFVGSTGYNFPFHVMFSVALGMWFVAVLWPFCDMARAIAEKAGKEAALAAAQTEYWRAKLERFNGGGGQS